MEGLSAWFDGQGNEVEYPIDAGEQFLNSHSLLWNKEFLRKMLGGEKETYLFGASGNIFDVLDLFDRVYFLKLDPSIQKERLQHETRENPMGSTEYQRENAVAWALELEDLARQLNIPFIDATLTPKEIFNQISS